MGLRLDLQLIKTNLECSVVLSTEGGAANRRVARCNRAGEVAIWGKNITCVFAEVRYLSAEI